MTSGQDDVFHIHCFPSGSDGKESACQCRRPGFDPGAGISLEKGMATTPVFVPAESLDRGAWRATVWDCKELGTTE